MKGERRFIATIARRLDSLGAITRGQRDSQTAMGGSDAALFRESDNLESVYARAALRQFYGALWHGSIQGWNLERFEKATGLKLTWEGNLKEDLPPMPRFLNRLLALPIAEQNQLFAELEEPHRRPTSSRRSRPAATRSASRPSPPTPSPSPAGRRSTSIPAPGPPPSWSRSCAATGWCRSPRNGIGDRRRRSRSRREAAPGRQRPLQARRRHPAGRVAHARRRRRAGAGAADPARHRRDHGHGPSSTPPTGAAPTRPRGGASGTPRLPACRRTGTRASGSPPACCCRSGTACRPRTCGSGASPRMTVSPSSGACSTPNRCAAVRAGFGLDGGPAMTGAEAFEAVMGRGNALALANGWRLARRRLMGADRIEIEGTGRHRHGRAEAHGMQSRDRLSSAPGYSRRTPVRSNASSTAGRSPPERRA